MRIVLYTHSLISDWNHGNAHFLRGVLRDLEARGHETLALEPEDSWSRAHLVAERGEAAIAQFAQDFPELTVATYGPDFDHAEALDRADVVIVHEWTEPALVERLGRLRRAGAGFTLCFHDTHHRAVSAEAEIGGLALDDYDLILAFGDTLRERYLARGWADRVHTWHEAADLRLFSPLPANGPRQDLIWVGNWGDGERARELYTFLTEPAARRGLSGTVRGVRYPDEALAKLAASGLRYGGSIANAEVPAAFARHRMTVHIPRRPYVEALPGIPTIRVFEALACGIPLISAPWDDAEGLFRQGDFIRVRTGGEMARAMSALRDDTAFADELARRGRETIESRHSCTHRVDELLAILSRLGSARTRQALPQTELL
ncbi:glycosyltransferase [Bosea sp. RCC_152_1]|uniref:CgeB family protein n=1 Tax=Bosea sp. RCC_152_1 TaxID=3239228 RepID=UPI0035261670